MNPDTSTFYLEEFCNRLRSEKTNFILILITKSCGYTIPWLTRRETYNLHDLFRYVENVFHLHALEYKLTFDLEGQISIPTSWLDYDPCFLFNHLNLRPLSHVNDILTYKIYLHDHHHDSSHLEEKVKE